MTVSTAEALTLGLDARCLRIQRTGVERMFFNFVTHLPERAGPFGRVILFTDGALEPGAFDDPLFTTVVVPPSSNPLARSFDHWITFRLPAELKRHAVDVFYSSNTKFPLCRVPSAVTVHGLEWWVRGADYRPIERLKQRVWMKLSLRLCAGIVTFTENTRDDIARFEPGSDKPVSVVGEAAASCFRRLAPSEIDPEVPARLGVTGPYVLSVCSLELRKNIDSLLRAFALVRDDAARGHTLVLVGRAAWRSSRLQALASEFGIADRVRFAGYVADEDLVQLYNQAALFVYPSRYEGFGLPVLEAMACGAPVACSSAGALREVAGDAALLFDPGSLPAMAEALRGPLCDPAVRARLVERGCRRAEDFDWGSTTMAIVALLKRLGER